MSVRRSCRNPNLRLGEELVRVTMFLGGMPRRPDKAEAHKTLRQHLTILGLWICAIRAAPFIFSLVTNRGEELELDFDD